MEQNDKLKPYAGLVGQEPAKKTLTYLLGKYKETHYFPNILFCAPKGQGKTTVAIETARHLCVFNELGKPELNAETGKPRIKRLEKVNCATLTNVKAFINDLLIRKVQDKDVTILFDEASEIPHGISMAMLDMFNTDAITSGTFRTTFSKEEFTCDIDFRRQSFLFATSEKHSVFHALLNRLEEIPLQEYSKDELAKIVCKGVPDVTIEKHVLDEISSVVRNNARDASLLARKLKVHIGTSGRKEFTMRDWNKIKDIFNIKPLGLDDIEVTILRYLAERTDGTSLTSLSAKTGLTKEALQRSHELFLQKNGLMEISTTGRLITAKGLNYLKELA